MVAWSNSTCLISVIYVGIVYNAIYNLHYLLRLGRCALICEAPSLLQRLRCPGFLAVVDVLGIVNFPSVEVITFVCVFSWYVKSRLNKVSCSASDLMFHNVSDT